ncbi:MAG: ATP-binding cassette domain-containing protein [Myxococcota bacterium]
MLNVVDVTQAFGQKVLFENVNVSFTPGKRYGLTGPNGAGKSTFMKFLAGEATPARGSITRPRKTSFLRQDHYGFEELRALDVVMMGNKHLWAAMQERDALLKKAETGDFSDEEGMRLGELEGVIAEENGYAAESEAATLLDGLGIEQKLQGEPMKNISGGYKLRVLLAQALFGKPDCLLLDEPTNHLDMDSIHWLERFLLDYEGILVVISHDRHFLNSVTTHIADIDYETIITYTGNYDEMVLQKSQVRSRVESENQDKARKIAQLKEFVARFGAGTRASQVQSRKKEIDKLQLTELKKSNIQRPFIRFPVGDKPGGKTVLRGERLGKRFEEPGRPPVQICRDLDLLLMRGDKLAIIGPSGIGKTTLLRMLLGTVTPDAGTCTWGHETDVGYFPQELERPEPGRKLWEWLQALDPRASREDVRGLLGRMLFSGDEGEKRTEVLSGGETVRLLFAKMMLLKHNVLIFDEPTNHLDLESCSALRDAFKAYEGTLIVVTHDHDIVADCATRILAMGRHGIEDFQGTYDEFLRKKGDVRLDR